MAKVLLTRPGYDLFAARRKFVSDVGIAFLVTALHRAGHDVDFVDMNQPRFSPKRFINLCAARKYDLIGMRALSSDSPQVKKVLRDIRSASPSTVTILGGPHASAMSKRIFDQFPELNLAMVGEGELGLVILADLLDRKEKHLSDISCELKGVPGLVYRADKDICVNEPSWINDLDSLGFPDFHAMNIPYFATHASSFFGPYIPLLTGRGCPMPCTFCASHKVSGRLRRNHSLDYLIEYLKVLKYRFNVNLVTLIDDNFLADIDFATALCHRMLQENLNMNWHCASNGIRADKLTEEMVNLMEKSGCRYIAFGIESASQRVLDLMKKRTSIELVLDKIEMVHKMSKIKVFGFFIIGYPGETTEERQLTLRKALQSHLSYADFLIFQPLPGSEIGDLVLRSVNLEGFRVFDYDRVSTVTDQRTALSLKRFQRKAYLRFYLRPRILLDFVLGLLKGDYRLKFMLKTTLSIFKPRGKDVRT